MRKGRYTIRRVVFTLMFLFAAWLPLVGYAHFMETKAERTLSPTTWVTGTEIQHLMKFHGTNVLKITDDQVLIWRTGKWIPVLERHHG